LKARAGVREERPFVLGAVIISDVMRAGSTAVFCSALAPFALALSTACGRETPTVPFDSAAALSSPDADTVPTDSPGTCDGGGAVDIDALSAGNFPRILRAGDGEYCLDAKIAARAYGDHAKATLDALCSEVLHEECALYESFGLTRFVSIRYVDGTAAGGVVLVRLSRFTDSENAYAFYTRRLVPEDPTDVHAPKPVEDAGGAGAVALGLTHAYVWRANEVAELAYTNARDPSQSDAPTSVLSEIARLLSLNIRGPEDKPASVAALPTAHLVSPGAVSYFPKDVLGVAGAGAGAVGYCREGNTSYRLVAIQTAGADKARQAMKAFEALPGATPFSGVGGTTEEGTYVVLQASPSAPKVGWWLTRTKGLVAGVGDEELVLDTRDAANTPGEIDPAGLTSADAIEVLKAWVAPRRAQTQGKKR
jgi:hypothetical protein